MTLEEAEVWLEGLINVERSPDLRAARLSLGPVRALLARVGDPQRGLRVLHVAGSKGKGSVAMLSEALLRGAGLRVGTFTSPHLESWTERFRVDGLPVDGARLAAVVERLRPHVEALRTGPEPPSWFDVTTAAAFVLFAEASLDVAVLEVGLGGRLDSTNVAEPAVCVVTHLELEHTEKLGATLGAIAAEKAGILKPGVPAVVAELAPEADAVVAARAETLAAPLSRAGRDFESSVREADATGSRVRFRDGPVAFEATLASPGRAAVVNASLALAAVRRLGLVPDAELAAVAQRAFAGARLAARIEVVSRAPWVVIDAAHTASSARELAAWLAGVARRRTHLVLSVSAGKDLASICATLAPHADVVTVTRAEPVRSLTPQEVGRAVRALAPEAELRVVPNPHLALRAAREGLGPEDLLCATGSVYLAGIARRVLGAPPVDAG